MAVRTTADFYRCTCTASARITTSATHRVSVVYSSNIVLGVTPYHYSGGCMIELHHRDPQQKLWLPYTYTYLPVEFLHVDASLYFNGCHAYPALRPRHLNAVDIHVRYSGKATHHLGDLGGSDIFSLPPVWMSTTSIQTTAILIKRVRASPTCTLAYLSTFEGHFGSALLCIDRCYHDT